MDHHRTPSRQVSTKHGHNATMGAYRRVLLQLEDGEEAEHGLLIFMVEAMACGGHLLGWERALSALWWSFILQSDGLLL